jgi:thiol-disulfide isomerase/thioredoxin
MENSPMIHSLPRKPAALAFVGLMTVAASAFAAGRPADAIIHDYEAVSVPKFDRGRRAEESYIKEFRDATIKAEKRRDELAWELFLADPDHEKVPQYLLDRWRNRMMDIPSAEATAAEIDHAMPRFAGTKLARAAAFLKVVAIITKNNEHPRDSMPAVDQFIKEDPKDQRGAILLNGFASTVKDIPLKTELLKRLVAEYPKTPAAEDAEKFLFLSDKIGKPFVLAFDDAVKGTHLSIEGLKGKVVVIDFWATWCGPCVAEMPKMKKLYAEFHDKGVEFIGVSLDDSKEKGGLDKLKDFVTKNEIPWPQYHQGNGWESEFSSGLGINAIPQLFLIDADGNLAEIEARGKLERLLPEYLAKAKGKTASGGK